MKDLRFSHKVAIVTGATGGIGSAIVKRLTEAGGKVLMIDIDSSKGHALVTEFNGAAVFLHGSVSEAATWEKAQSMALEKWGCITTVINNAGLALPPKRAHELTMAQYDSVFDVNVRPIFLSVQTLVPKMLDSDNVCSFVNIASTAATRPRPGTSIYSASKAAVLFATKVMAHDYGPKIRFNVVAPGLVDTNMLYGLLEDRIQLGSSDQERVATAASALPMRRAATGRDIANGVLYLVSDEAALVTGSVLSIDGGWGI